MRVGCCHRHERHLTRLSCPTDWRFSITRNAPLQVVEVVGEWRAGAEYIQDATRSYVSCRKALVTGADRTTRAFRDTSATTHVLSVV